MVSPDITAHNGRHSNLLFFLECPPPEMRLVDCALPFYCAYLFSICRSSVFERCHSFWKSSVYQRCVRHVTRSRTRFSREFRARGGDQGTLGSAITESITRIAINTALSAIGVDERARITRAFNARTTSQIEIKPAIFLHSTNILVSVFQPCTEEMSSTLFHEQWDVRCL